MTPPLLGLVLTLGASTDRPVSAATVLACQARAAATHQRCVGSALVGHCDRIHAAWRALCTAHPTALSVPVPCVPDATSDPSHTRG